MEEEEQERYRCQSNLDRSEYEKKEAQFRKLARRPPKGHRAGCQRARKHQTSS